jgi:hypothetical protein
LNDDGSPDAHVSSMASTEVSSPLHGSGGTHGTSEQCGLIADLRQFRTPRVIRRIQSWQLKVIAREMSLNYALKGALQFALHAARLAWITLSCGR